MGSRARFGVVALACAAAAGCSLLVGTEGLEGPPVSAPTEAGSPAETSVAADAGSDASSPDAAAEAGLCDDSFLCDDFEGTSTVFWSTFDGASVGGTVLRDGERPRSGMRSLHCTRTTPSTGRAYLKTSVVPAAFTCELDVFAQGVPAGDNVEVLTLQRAVSGLDAYEPGYVYLRPAGALLGEYKNFPDGGEEVRTKDLAIPGGDLDHWVHLTVALTSTTSTLGVSVDGVATGSVSLTLTETASPPTGLLVGITYGTNKAAPTVFVDNVVCRAR
jgi:hypothetical protein